MYQAKSDTGNEIIALDIKQFEEWGFDQACVDFMTPKQLFGTWGAKHGWVHFYSFLLFIEEIYWREKVQK